MHGPRRTGLLGIIITLLVAGPAAGGCGKRKDDAKGAKSSPMAAEQPSMQRPMVTTPTKAPVMSSKTAHRPAQPIPPKRLAPLPWPPPKIKAPKLRATCRSLCGTGEKGVFLDKCSCKGKGLPSPLAARRTSKYHDFFKRYEYEVVNRSNRPVSWASANLYYYDATGRQLTVVLKDKTGKDKPRTFKRYRINGSNFTVPANTTKKITLGWSREEEPRATARVEVVFDGWCYGERHKKTYKDINQLCVWTQSPPEDRPMTATDVLGQLMGAPDGPGLGTLRGNVPTVRIRATIEAHSTDGPLRANVVKRVVKKQLVAIAHCYRPKLGGPKLPGTLKTTLSIDAGGKVTKAQRTGGTLSRYVGPACVLRLLRRLRFPGRSSRPTRASFTFHITHANK